MSENLTIKLKIVTPERIVLETDVTQVSLPTESGEITILPNHIPLISVLKSGIIDTKTDDGKTNNLLAVSGGFVEVFKNSLIILADTAEKAEELDEIKIEEAKAKAKRIKKELATADPTKFIELNVKLEKYLARSRALKRWQERNNK